ncbi:MAG: hypothetical protein GWN11_12715 [Candidatus Dadabacteria bacterium]|nr:hypothetical protein [Candidatus Dadabacteria bacterium]NIX16698.1 hypothetical protein [Candidatus Dadabacteria bacterium]
MKQIIKTAVSLILIFVIGFTTGIAVNKMQNMHSGHQGHISMDALSKK